MQNKYEKPKKKHSKTFVQFNFQQSKLDFIAPSFEEMFYKNNF